MGTIDDAKTQFEKRASHLVDFRYRRRSVQHSHPYMILTRDRHHQNLVRTTSGTAGRSVLGRHRDGDLSRRCGEKKLRDVRALQMSRRECRAVLIASVSSLATSTMGSYMKSNQAQQLPEDM